MASTKTKSVVKDDASSKAVKAPKSSPAKAEKGKKSSGKPSLLARVKEYFTGVRQETKRVVWPSREELVKYSMAVIAMLIFFGVLIYLVDTAIVPLLFAFSGLRG